MMRKGNMIGRSRITPRQLRQTQGLLRPTLIGGWLTTSRSNTISPGRILVRLMEWVIKFLPNFSIISVRHREERIYKVGVSS
jgi:hypothetical protein